MSQVAETNMETKVPIVNEVVDKTAEEKDMSSLEFTRENIEAQGDRIKLTDHDDETGLDLFSYVNCTSDDSELVKNCRGVVFKDDKIVMKAFPYTTEYGETEMELIEKNIIPYFSGCKFFDSHEGALIRMFNFSGKWFISTHRKLNAFRSKWASNESFGTSFKKALEAEVENNSVLSNSLPEGDENLLERFQKTLDPEKQYMFLICNTSENRIVCIPPSRLALYHVGTFVGDDLVMDVDINIPHPREHKFSNSEELYNYVRDVDPRDLQGVIIFTPNNLQYKILQRDYQELFRVRGNEPSIKFRYLQVRMNKKFTDMLYTLYPEMGETFDEYENCLYDVAGNIYNAYVQRFIKKTYITVPKEDFVVVKECHSWHEQNRQVNRINMDKVIEVLNRQPPTNLNRMIRRLRAERLKKSKGEDEQQSLLKKQKE